MQAEKKLMIEQGSYEIKTGGGSSNVSTNNTWGLWGKQESVDVDSAKGLKVGDNLVIKDGKIVFDTSDDSIHSSGSVEIQNGNYVISSGDDGIHVDDVLIIQSGDIDIQQSYEGLEASEMTINNGNIKVVSRDDGINVAGGKDASSMNRPGANNFKQNSNHKLTIHGGTIYVNANGDGIDVNGSAYIYGGIIHVDGPSDRGNGALDYDGEFVVNGGEVIAVGSSGMLQGIGANSTQNNIIVVFSNSYKGGDSITILDSDEKEILSYKASKAFNSLVFSSSKLEKGKTYTIKVNGTNTDEFTVNGVSTTVGSNVMSGGMGGHGGGHGRR